MATRNQCGAMSPTWTKCQRAKEHRGLHRGRTAAGDIAQWPEDALSYHDVQRFVG